MSDYVLLRETKKPNARLEKRDRSSDSARQWIKVCSVFAGLFLIATMLCACSDDEYVSNRRVRSGVSVSSESEKSCMSLDNVGSCNQESGCVWCESGAIPSRCYTTKNAGMLPPGVFTCTKKEKEKALHLTLNSYEKKLEEPLCDPTVNQAAGYFKIGDEDKNYFFWFFESRGNPEKDPLVLWMTGGPGCSSELALLVENGPCQVMQNGESTVLNRYSWNSNANLIYIDQPAGTGFSYGRHDTNEIQVGDDMNLFLREFLHKFPQFQNNEFFIFGESYAGHYVPATAHSVYRHNQREAFKINMKGIAIGNGLTNPEIQYQYYADMAYQSGTAPARVTEEQFLQMKEATPQCLRLIKTCNRNLYDTSCLNAVNYCNEVLFGPYQESGYNQYDMRQKCEVAGLCYDFSGLTKFLHTKKVLDYLGIPPQKRDWVSCDMSAHDALMADWMKDYQDWVAELLENDVRVLVYAGDVDFIVNYLGCRAWPLALEWSGKEGYNRVGEEGWFVDGAEAGLLRKYKNLSFLQVYQAGHMVPMDKPKEALVMLNSFLRNQGL